MALPPAVETVTVTYGPFPDFQGNMLDGTVTFTPVSPVPVVHVPTGTPIVKRPITVAFDADSGSVGAVTLPATDASDLTVTDFSYNVTVKFRQTDAENWPAKLIQLPRDAPTVDLDVLPPVTAATGVVINYPAVLSVAALTGVITAQQLIDALGVIPGAGAGTSDTVMALGDVTGNVVLDVSQANVFAARIVGPTTFTFAGWPAGDVATEPTVIANQDAIGHTITFAGITWLPVGTSPVFQVGANQTNITTFFSTDNGVTVYGQGGSLSGGGYGVYGDGGDGVVTLDGTTTPPSGIGVGGPGFYYLARDFHADTLTVGAGISLEMGQAGRPYRLRVKNTLTVAAGGIITAAAGANAASGATPARNATGGSMLAGGDGGAGSTTTPGGAGANVTSFTGSTGGRGGHPAGATSGGGAAGVASAPASGVPRSIPDLATMYVTTPTGTTFLAGGAGGGGGGGDGTAAGGGGGRGGNPVWIAARSIVNNGSIQSNGSPGAAATGGNAGGGGGGMGGVVVYIYSTYSGSGVIQTLGGVGAAGAGTGGGGVTGGGGRIMALVN